MTSRELHDWVEKQGVPAKWQMPVVQLLRGLLEEDRVWPHFSGNAWLTLSWDRMEVLLLPTSEVLLGIMDDWSMRRACYAGSGHGMQRIPLGADWVREAIRLAPKKPDTLKEAGIYPCNPFVNYTNEKPAPSLVGGYKASKPVVTPLPTGPVAASSYRWQELFLPSGTAVQTVVAFDAKHAQRTRHRIRVTCDLSKCGVEQAIIDLHEYGNGDKPSHLKVGWLDTGNWAWIYENRGWLQHMGINVERCERTPQLGRDEWLLVGEKNEIYSEGA